MSSGWLANCVQKGKVAHSDLPSRPRSFASLPDASARYESPPASQLQRLMWTKTGSECNHMDQVQPRIFLGDMYAAKDKRSLKAHGISHVLNAAHGKFNVNTGATFYRDVKVAYHGVEAFDMVTFDLSVFFYRAADFIRSALSSPTGRVLVHCAMGLSRSSTLVLAYLMIHERMTLAEAIVAVSVKRNIAPNRGFLEQLRALDVELQSPRHKATGGT
ncbi:dual specificity protein phosphatase 13B-like [Syngnathus typhle]|uniref:dual specificity protein phosphatase 13B-like n=1 Tax=Syngnathus typhle TaxID=161592 RepID=UPI002A699351|nr:dual specificity protein phosphatase 13B-like [Syngnathus typhle]